MNSLAKIGLFGSASGDNHDITVAPLRLETITIYSGDVVDSLAFSYRDRENQLHTAGRWGGTGGGIRQIQLGPSEYVKEVNGTYGLYTYGTHGRVEAITNFTIVTNHRSYGPYGTGKLDTETRFSVPVMNNGSIVGFFAHTGRYYVNGVGVYVKPF
uniref:Jacalin-type lectin domain-containing protein n=1 Tax=Arundo donax TaxID=35708 RepID=A0A0A9BQN6_ARUDO